MSTPKPELPSQEEAYADVNTDIVQPAPLGSLPQGFRPSEATKNAPNQDVMTAGRNPGEPEFPYVPHPSQSEAPQE